MKNQFLEDKTQEFFNHLRKKNEYQLVNDFNRETQQKGWVSVRGSYLEALRMAFKEKGIDDSAVNHGAGFSLKYPVYLSTLNKKKELVLIITD